MENSNSTLTPLNLTNKCLFFPSCQICPKGDSGLWGEVQGGQYQPCLRYLWIQPPTRS